MSLGRSFLWLNSAEILFFTSSYIIHGFLGRYLGPSDYGRYSVVIALSTAILLFLGDGVPKALSKYTAAYPERSQAVFKQSLKLQVIMVTLVFALFYILTPYISSALGDPTLTPLFRISAFIIPVFASSSFLVHYFNGRRLFKVQALLKYVRSVSRLIIIPLLAVYLGIKGAVAGYILVPVVVLSVSLPLYFRNREKEKRTIPFSSRKLLEFAIPIMLFMVFYEALINLDLFMVKRLLSSDALTGIYSASILIGRTSFYLLSVLGMILLPTMSHILENKGKKAALEMMKNTFKYLWFVLILFVFIWPVWSPTIVELFFSARYTEEILFTRILAGGLPFLTIFYIMAFTLNGAGETKKVALFTAAGVVLNVFLNLILIPRFGLAGAAIATAGTSVILGITMLVLGFKVIGRFLSNKTMFLPVAIMAVSIIPALLMGYYGVNNYTILAYTFIPFIIYILILNRTGELNFRELLGNFKGKKVSP